MFCGSKDETDRQGKASAPVEVAAGPCPASSCRQPTGCASEAHRTIRADRRHDLAALDVLADDLARMGVPFERSQMFGFGLQRPGNGKFFATVLGRDVMFQSSGVRRAEALARWRSARLRTDTGRQMKQWIVIARRLIPTMARVRGVG